jgi:hypothetical protein
MAAVRSPAQIEAARRNGAKSRGPVTPEGKARSSKNALKHGLTTPEHILLEGEDEAAFTALHESLIEENEPESPTEIQLVHRLAVTFWKQARADRLEAKLLANTDPPRFITSEGIEPGDSEAFFDLRRFNAIRGYQAQLSHEVSRCLAELRRLKAARSDASKLSAANENEPEERLSTLAVALTAPAGDGSTARSSPHIERPCLGSPDSDGRPKQTESLPSLAQAPLPRASEGQAGR